MTGIINLNTIEEIIGSIYELEKDDDTEIMIMK